MREIKQKFIEDGGAEEDFKFEDVLEIRFKELYKRFKDQKNQFNESIEKEKLQNLVKHSSKISFILSISCNHILNDYSKVYKAFH